RADVVLVCVRPQDAPGALWELSFGASQTVISVMAGVPLRAVRGMVAPAEDVVRAIPLPAVARRSGLTAIHPPHDGARAILGRTTTPPAAASTSSSWPPCAAPAPSTAWAARWTTSAGGSRASDAGDVSFGRR